MAAPCVVFPSVADAESALPGALPDHLRALLSVQLEGPPLTEPVRSAVTDSRVSTASAGRVEERVALCGDSPVVDGRHAAPSSAAVSQQEGV